jgi:protein involved in polysaccharide export with SLBB domain
MIRNFLLVAALSVLAAQPVFSDEDSSDGAMEYRLSAGDRVLITVFGHEDLSGEFEINGANVISMPLIPEIVAAGLTVNELEAAIVDALKPDYLKNPNVSVEVTNYRPFYIIGEVTRPGSYPYSNKMTVVNAVALAGGFTHRAKKNRAVIKRTEDGDTTEFEAEMDVVIEPGDVIEIKERFF